MMRGWLVALVVVGSVVSVWGQEQPEVYFSTPQPGAAIDGAPWVTVTGRARGPEVPPTTGFDVMLVLDTSGSTASSSRGLMGTLDWARLGGGIIRYSPLRAPPQESILGAEVTAALNFLGQVDGARTRVGVIIFAQGYRIDAAGAGSSTANAVVVQPLTSDLQAVRSALKRVLAGGSDGGTD